MSFSHWSPLLHLALTHVTHTSYPSRYEINRLYARVEELRNQDHADHHQDLIRVEEEDEEPHSPAMVNGTSSDARDARDAHQQGGPARSADAVEAAGCGAARQRDIDGAGGTCLSQRH